MVITWTFSEHMLFRLQNGSEVGVKDFKEIKVSSYILVKVTISTGSIGNGGVVIFTSVDVPTLFDFYDLMCSLNRDKVRNQSLLLFCCRKTVLIVSGD